MSGCLLLSRSLVCASGLAFPVCLSVSMINFFSKSYFKSTCLYTTVLPLLFTTIVSIASCAVLPSIAMHLLMMQSAFDRFGPMRIMFVVYPLVCAIVCL